MRLTLPLPDHEVHALMRAAAAPACGHLYAVRKRPGPDGTLFLSAKIADSFGFVDHPRLTAAPEQERLLDYRCDCPSFLRTRRFCVHCASLALSFCTELRPEEKVAEYAEPSGQEDAAAVPDHAEPSADEAPVQPAPYRIEELSYSFCNSARHLYPGKQNPRIPLVRYYQMFGQNAMARMLYSRHPSWGGSCFGITATASMFCQPEDPIRVCDFSPDAEYPSQLLLTSRSGSLGMTLHTFIEGMHILQYHALISRQRHEHLGEENALDALCRHVQAFQADRLNPVAMGIWRSAKMDGGHSVFPYRLESLPDGGDRLHIYDPNHPLQTRFAYLEKDANGHYTNWRFPMNDKTEYSSAAGGRLSYDMYATFKKVWDERGGRQSDAILCAAPGVAVTDDCGTLLVRITDEGVETYQDGIFQIPVTDAAEGNGGEVLLYMPAGHYLVRNEDPAREELCVQLTHTDQSVSLRTTAREAAVMVNDGHMTAYVHITQPECSYTVEFDTADENASQTIRLDGITGEDGLLFVRCRGKLHASGLCEDGRTSLYVDEELSDLSCIDRNLPAIFSREEQPQRSAQYITNTDTVGTTDVTGG